MGCPAAAIKPKAIGRLNRPYSKFIRGLFHRLRVGECRANNNGRIKFCDGAESPEAPLGVRVGELVDDQVKSARHLLPGDM